MAIPAADQAADQAASQNIDQTTAPAPAPPAAPTAVNAVNTAIDAPSNQSHRASGGRPAPEPALAPVSFRHPQATREIHLGPHLVGYALKRARRRSIGFVVAADGLSVSAPRWVGLGEVEEALRGKAAWILRKLHEQGERQRRLQAARVDWRDGVRLPFLGAGIEVVIDAASPGAVLRERAAADDGPRWRLHLGLPADAAPERIRDAVQGWLQRQARRVFEERCAHFSAQLGVRVRRISLSSAQTRWGSASADGSIRLNWRLVHFALPTIDYVVAHELAHLRHMDHSPSFWGVVRSVMPDYEQSRAALRTQVLPVMD